MAKILTQDDETMFQVLAKGGYQHFCKYYFDWEPLKNQFIDHFAPQANVIHLGGVGSGKTMGRAISFLTSALSIPHYLGLNTSVSSFQAKLLFDKLMPYVSLPRVEKFITDVRTRPYPIIETIFESKIACMTAGFQATLIRGSEWDEINGDEFGYERYEETLFALRGRLRGKRPDHTYRKAQLRITTTPTDVEWLRRWWDRGDKSSGSEELNVKRYLSLRSTLFDNTHIPEWQREEIMAGYTEEMVQQEIMAEFPEWGNTEIPLKFIDACEDLWMNHEMEQMINPVYMDEGGTEHSGTPVPGANAMELPRVGVTLWETPYDRSKLYLLASDPGTASPPRRNSPVVMVWDVTEKPYKLVYFHWVSGGGSYTPWLSSFKYALEKYKPLIKGIDATGTQKAIDDLVFEREGIPVDSVNFARDKIGMLNALKLLFQNHELRFPYIKGVRHQCRTYKIPDEDLVQDIVSTMMVFAYLTRYLPSDRQQSKRSYQITPHAVSHRKLRTRKLRGRRRDGARRQFHRGPR